MRRAFGSLTAQLVVVVVAALAVAQAISLWLFVDERGLAIRAALGFEAAGRAANVARLIEEAPPELHASILRAANSPLVRFDMGERPAVTEPDHHHAAPIEARVRAMLGAGPEREIRVTLREIEGQILPLPHLSPRMAEMHHAMMRGELSAIEMNLSIALAGGRWLNVGTRFERPPLQWPLVSTLTFGLTAALILVSVSWLLLSRVTGPLRRMARAADRLGRGEPVDPLPVRGPDELRDLTRAFNRMEDRLTRFVADRTRLLAAVGHDLRSPLTALRVRAEMVEDDETRESLIESIEEMQAMAEAALTFAEGLTAAEPPETVEVGAFLEELRQDMVEPFALVDGPAVTLRARPRALRRALRNLVGNAVRYGGTARVGWRREGEDLLIEVEDDGPGIPPDRIEQVFDPFYRLEESRSRDTGGHGLGLSIARSILRAHGGEVTLANRPGGGLSARVVLPLGGGEDDRRRESGDAETLEDSGGRRGARPGGGLRGPGRGLARRI